MTLNMHSKFCNFGWYVQYISFIYHTASKIPTTKAEGGLHIYLYTMPIVIWQFHTFMKKYTNSYSMNICCMKNRLIVLFLFRLCSLTQSHLLSAICNAVKLAHVTKRHKGSKSMITILTSSSSYNCFLCLTFALLHTQISSHYQQLL